MAKKGKERQRSIDAGKISSLFAAGWSIEAISEEMGITSEKIRESVECMNAEQTEECKMAGREPNPAKFIVLTSEELKNIYERAAAVGAREAMDRIDKERKKEYDQKADRRIHNTKLLLRNYRMLREHAENSVFSRTQMDESAFDILEAMMQSRDNDVIIGSIRESAARTAIMVSHVETMVGLYATFCEKSPNREIECRRYDVVWDMYMAEQNLSAREIAEKHNMSKENVYADLRVAIERLTALFFGVDGLKVQ